MPFNTQALFFLSLSHSTVGRFSLSILSSLNGRRAEIFCEMIARFFFPLDFLQGLDGDSPTKEDMTT